MSELLEKVSKWEEYVEEEISRITQTFEKKFRPIILNELQGLADETGYEIDLTSGMGSVSCDVNDYENNIQYEVDVVGRFTRNLTPKAVDVTVKRLDPSKEWNDPAPGDPDADDVELVDEAYFNMLKKRQEQFAGLGDIIELMTTAQQTDGMVGMDFKVKPKR